MALTKTKRDYWSAKILARLGREQGYMAHNLLFSELVRTKNNELYFLDQLRELESIGYIQRTVKNYEHYYRKNV